MDCWPVDCVDTGFQHEAVAWSGSIKSKDTDFPRKHQKLRPFISPHAYSQPLSYDDLDLIKNDLSTDLFGITARTDSDIYQFEMTEHDFTSGDVDGPSWSDHDETEYEKENAIFLEMQTGAPPAALMPADQVSPAAHHHSRESLTSEDRSLKTSHEKVHTLRTLPPIVPGPGPGPPNRHLSFPSTPIIKNNPITRQEHGQLEIAREWQKIRKLRESTWSQRSKIHEIRQDLRKKQNEKSRADDIYLQFVRLQTLKAPKNTQNMSDIQETMEKLASDCEKARDEYGPLEDDCNWLEDQLGRDEFELSRLEEHLFNRVDDPPNFRAEETISEPDSPAASAYSDSDIGQDPHHPLVSRFLSRMGDVGILEERLTSHIEERYALEAEKESRQLVGHELAPEDQETLDNFEDTFTKLMRQIEDAREQADILKQECLQEGLVDKYGKPTDFERLEEQTFMDEVNAGFEKSEYVKFPVLIPRPGIHEIRFYDAGPKPDEISHSAGDHINQWLLHKLRSSPLEVNMLVRIFESKFGRIQDDHWQIHVVTLWYVDGARKGASKYRVYSSGTDTQPLQNSHFISPDESLSEGMEL